MVEIRLNANNFFVVSINNEAALCFTYSAKRFLSFHKFQPYLCAYGKWFAGLLDTDIQQQNHFMMSVPAARWCLALTIKMHNKGL